MKIVYETMFSEDITTVWRKLEEWKKLFVESGNDPFFEKHHLALKYVLYSTEAFLLLKIKEYKKVSFLLNSK